MEPVRLYENWPKDLFFWQNQLRHLYWVSLFRVNLLSTLMPLKEIRCLDLGSGPQFTAELLRQAGALVVTVDRFAPADYEADINNALARTLSLEKPFHLILMGAVIRYVKNPESFFEETASLLESDGLLFIDEYAHSPANDLYLDCMTRMGAMEQWPEENFPTLKSIKDSLSLCKSLKIERIFSCWPGFFLEGEYPFCLWHTLAVKKIL